MILWSIFALMTMGVVIAVWLPLTRQQRPVRSGSDIAVYRDQLDEIDRDEAASRIGAVEVPTHEGETVKADPAINPNQLLPARLAYYRYPGSLTTPPCSETVEWLLLTNPIQVADADIAGFAKLYAMNARPAQKANRRAVLRSG